MTLKQQMNDLGELGGASYEPSDAMIASLLGRTKRVRAVRQSASTAVTTLGVVAVGFAAVQAYQATKNDPAFHDRNIIDKKDNLTPIEQYRAKYGQENPTRDSDVTIDLGKIIALLEEAALKDPTMPGSGEQPQTPQNTAPAKPTTDTPKETTKPSEPGSTCSKPAVTGATYNCDTGQYVANDGWFMFGNGAFYQTVKWTDAATGLQAWGNWSGTGKGWDQKAIFLSSSTDKEYDYYQYLGDQVTWSGTTCNGITKTKYNAPVKVSCMPHWMVDSTGKEHFEHGGIVYIVTDANYKWHPDRGQYENITAPPAGWTWNGSAWVTTSTPSP